MSAISTILTRLRAAIWAIDVRDDIANAIEQCYSDVSNPTLQTEALEAALQEKIDQGEMAALTIGDHTITAAKLAQGVIDNTLATSGAAADAAETGRQIDLLKADLGAQTGVISLIKDYYIRTSGTPIDLTPMPSSVGRMYAVVDCTAGDKFVINAYSESSDSRTWCFIDSTNNVISMADADTAVTDLELTAPENAVKLIINDKSGGISYKVGNNLVSRVSDLDAKVLNNDIKAALINVVSHIGAWTDEHGQDYVDALKVALNYDFYNIANRSVSNGLLTMRQGGAGITTAIPGYAPAIIGWSASSPRYSVYVPNGIEEVYVVESTDHVQGVYPIPVPENKRNVTITITPSGQYFACVEFSHNGTEYQRVKDNGWKTSGTTIALQESTSFIMVHTKYDSDGRTYPNPPTDIVIKFTTN